jgi:prepilin-type N-terminal cleavage/methylation domain-containing protein
MVEAKWMEQVTSSESGFNLVELMVAVGIIAFLASHAVSRYQQVTKTAVAHAQIKALAKQIASAREAMGDGTVLFMLTGSTCSCCSCGVYTGVGEFSASCMSAQEAAWKALGWKSPPLSPWGNPYMIDENEMEWGPSIPISDSVIAWIPHDKVWISTPVNPLNSYAEPVIPLTTMWKAP